MSDQTHADFILPPRRASFLARYPRNLKMAVAAALFALIVLPPAFLHQHGHDAHAPTATSRAVLSPEYTPQISTDKIVASDIHAPALNDQDDHSVKLIQAPDSRITEDTQEGSLPRISEDGLQPWQIYARPFNNADLRPRIALVVTGLGWSRTITDRVIDQLPPTVTLAFGSDAPVVGSWVSRARQDGHEVLLDLPMEPFDFPQSDPGPQTLLSSLPNSDNLARMLKGLRAASGYVGITSTSGSRFTTDSTKLAPVLQVVRDRGLLILDARAAPHSAVYDMAHNATLPAARVTQRLDGDLSPDAITDALNNLEKTAVQNGRAVAITSATPVMITQLQAWFKTLPQHGIALAPLSSTLQ